MTDPYLADALAKLEHLSPTEVVQAPPALDRDTDLALKPIVLPIDFPHGDGPANTLRTPVFIVGSPRSGTSVLTNALLAAGYRGYREGNYLTLLRAFENATNRHIQSFGKPNDKVLAGRVDWLGFMDDVAAAFKKQVDLLNPISPWMDKSGNPEMIEVIPQLLRLWPSAIFIFAKRRSIENIISRLLKFPGHTFEYHCRDWARNMTTWREMRDLEGLTYIEIDQQEIAQTPEKVADELTTFIHGDNAARERVLKVFTGDRPQQTNEGSAKRVLGLSSAGWSEQQIRTFKVACSAEMDRYGYSMDEKYWLPAHGTTSDVRA